MLKLRAYEHDTDFPAVSRWVKDERTYALWSARHVPYPIEKDSFAEFLKNAAELKGDKPFVAVDDEDKAVGFFTYALNSETNEGMLKFVIVDSEKRGHGYGKEMISLAVKYAFEQTSAEMVHLNVFSVNDRAVGCYKGAGFTERDRTDNAFSYNEESWGRVNMVFWKKDFDK